jgi:hypothetical protein
LVYKDECEEFSYTLLCGNTSIHQPYFLYSAKFCTIEENKNIKGIFLLLLGGGCAHLQHNIAYHIGCCHFKAFNSNYGIGLEQNKVLFHLNFFPMAQPNVGPCENS